MTGPQQVGMAAATVQGGEAAELPTEPPPDYEYAVNHPAAGQQQLPPAYRVAVTLPSYQQAELDKGPTYNS